VTLTGDLAIRFNGDYVIKTPLVMSIVSKFPGVSLKCAWRDRRISLTRPFNLNHILFGPDDKSPAKKSIFPVIVFNKIAAA
jgi:hypothetical protein